MQLGVSIAAGSETTISMEICPVSLKLLSRGYIVIMSSSRDAPLLICIFCSQMTNQCEVGFKSDADVDVNYSLPNQK